MTPLLPASASHKLSIAPPGKGADHAPPNAQGPGLGQAQGPGLGHAQGPGLGLVRTPSTNSSMYFKIPDDDDGDDEDGDEESEGMKCELVASVSTYSPGRGQG